MKFFITDEYNDIVNEAWDDIDGSALDDEENVETDGPKELYRYGWELNDRLRNHEINGWSLELSFAGAWEWSNPKSEILIYTTPFWEGAHGIVCAIARGGDLLDEYTIPFDATWDADADYERLIGTIIHELSLGSIRQKLKEFDPLNNPTINEERSWDKLDHSDIDKEESKELGHKLYTFADKEQMRATISNKVMSRNAYYVVKGVKQRFTYKQIRSGYGSNMYPSLALWRISDEEGRRGSRVSNWKYKITIFYEGALNIRVVKTRRDRKQILEERIIPYEPDFDPKKPKDLDVNYFISCVQEGLTPILEDDDSLD